MGFFGEIKFEDKFRCISLHGRDGILWLREREYDVNEEEWLRKCNLVGVPK